MKRPIAWMALGGALTIVLFLALTLVAGSLRMSAAAMSEPMAQRYLEAPPEVAAMAASPAPEPVPQSEAPKMMMKRLAPGRGAMMGIGSMGGPKGGGDADGFGGVMPTDAPEMEEGEADRGGAEAPAPTRAWFPETFLFEPLVVTNAGGEASVPVKVPDRLTRWRVLALAHSRTGGQGGAVASFASTLPTYVDPVVPAFLTAGDQVRLPVQVVNTTSSSASKTLVVQAEGPQAVGGGSWAVTIPPEGSLVQYASLTVGEPGRVTVRASLGGADQIVRTIDVLPGGRPVLETRGGTLAAPRSFQVEVPADALPRSERARLLVYPGSLALVRSELSVARRRPGAAEDAYALFLVGRAPAILKALGEAADPSALKELKIALAQRAVAHGRSAPPHVATLLAEAALAFPEDRTLAGLGGRLAMSLAQQQSPDGTCGGETGWTEQRLLVATAECVRAIRAAQGQPAGKARAQLATVRASGAFERALPRIDDAYTAAAALASGAVQGAPAEALRKVVLAAIQGRADGSKYLAVAGDLQRADGAAPSEAEATALAILALRGDPKAPVADLGATLLGSYSPHYGWGDGRANLAALQAVAELFKEKVPDRVSVVLKLDGKVIAEGVLDASKTRDVLALEAAAPGAAGSHQWTVEATPAVPGLGFSLAVSASVPWKTDPAASGLELQIRTAGEMTVGRAASVEVIAATPGGDPADIRHALPAGVQADTSSLERLQGEGVISGYQVEDGTVVLHAEARPPGQPFRATYRVIPTISGTLHATASSIALPGGEPQYVAPAVWNVR